MSKIFANRHAPLLAFVILALIGGWAIRSSAAESSHEIRKAQVAQCEASKVTASLQADAMEARVDYISRLLLAPSVEDDVRSAARKELVVVRATAERWRHRAARNCLKEFGEK